MGSLYVMCAAVKNRFKAVQERVIVCGSEGKSGVRCRERLKRGNERRTRGETKGVQGSMLCVIVG